MINDRLEKVKLAKACEPEDKVIVISKERHSRILQRKENCENCRKLTSKTKLCSYCSQSVKKKNVNWNSMAVFKVRVQDMYQGLSILNTIRD